jgi:hypothetical protein
MEFDRRHGGPYDRGSADSYYRRPYNPHYFKGGSYMSKEVTLADMTAEEIVAYTRGFNDNEADYNFKEYY